jgi:uncharacterized membrane protein
VTTTAEESGFERITALFMIAVFWIAFACLAGGLAAWLAAPAHAAGPLLLTAGLLGLLTIPIVRLVTVVAVSLRQRDWITLWATIAVMLILFALTLRDASSLRP